MKPLAIRLSTFLLALVMLPSVAVAQKTLSPESRTQMDQGHEALKAGKYKDAIESFKKANILENHVCGECSLFLAIAYFRSDDFKHARENIDVAIDQIEDADNLAVAHSVKGKLLATEANADSKKLPLAESEFRAAAELEPKSAIYHMNLARVLLLQSKDNDAKDELQTCLALNPDEAMTREARLYLADPRRGRQELAPEFELTTLRGEQISLRQLAGRVVVMDFWATWCPPCRESVPELKALTKRYPTDKLVLISISADSDEKVWEEFVAKKKMDWAQYRDSSHKIQNAYAIHSFPTYMVIDADGFVRKRLTGLNPQETVVHRLKATLQQIPSLEGEARK